MCCWEWSHQPGRISCHRSTLTAHTNELFLFWSAVHRRLNGGCPPQRNIQQDENESHCTAKRKVVKRQREHYSKEPTVLTVTLPSFFFMYLSNTEEIQKKEKKNTEEETKVIKSEIRFSGFLFV